MEEQHYCLVHLAESGRTLAQLRSRLPKAKEKYDQQKGTANETAALADLYKLATALWSELIAVIQLLQELDNAKMVATAEKLYAAVKRFDFLNAGYDRLCAALEAFENSLPSPERSISAGTLGRLMNRVKMGYFPTDLTHVSWMKQVIAFPKGQVNIFDPCCGCGLALSALSEDRNAVSYGVEIDEYRAEEAQKRLNRVAFGSFFHARISHEAFHCVFLNPPYLSAITKGGGSARMEKTFLAGSIPHLMQGGLLIYIVPYYRVTDDVCRVLCDNFMDLSAYRFADSEFKKFRQVVLFGRRKKREDGSDAVNALLSRFLSPDALPCLSEITPGQYALPEKTKNVDCFKGAVFNMNELAAQLEKSTSTNILFEGSRLEQMEKRPPLPLNVSQIGLVGGSGMMNGLMECETPHVVKGRIVRQHKSEILDQTSTEQQMTTELREITSNRMIFNVLTPAGFKSLT